MKMKKTIKLAVVAALALGATSAFATNGDHLIGLGAKARGMGGVGIGMSHGAESGLSNPALITSVKNTQISFGGTIFMPDVSYDGGAGYQDSAADMSIIPEVSVATKINDNLYIGVGMWGTAGMGTDYRDSGTNFAPSNGNGTMNMITNLQLMQFGVPIAYKTNGISVGITPILQYGALDMDYRFTTPVAFGGNDIYAGNGVAQDLAFGYTLGVAYDLSEVGAKGLTLGAVYKSAIEMEYKGILTNATQPFVDFGIIPTGMISDKLEQPAEIGVGLSYNMEQHTLAFDYKQIQWESATGYKEFGWEDQSVYMIGYQFAEDNWAVRLGYNYGKNPIKEQQSGGTAVTGAPGTMALAGGDALNMLNLLGFPAVVESHYTIGGTFAANETVSFDAAFAYAPETTESYSTAGLANVGMSGPSANVKHSQTSVSLQANFAF